MDINDTLAECQKEKAVVLLDRLFESLPDNDRLALVDRVFIQLLKSPAFPQ